MVDARRIEFSPTTASKTRLHCTWCSAVAADRLKQATRIDQVPGGEALRECAVESTEILRCFSLRRPRGEPMQAHDGAQFEGRRPLSPRHLDRGIERVFRGAPVGRLQQLAAESMDLGFP